MPTKAENKRRIKRALHTLKVYTEIDPKRDFYTHEIEEGISDLLSDIRHLCDSMNIDFAKCDRRAYYNYVEEKVIPLKK